MQLSARELAALLNGVVEGDPEIQVSRPSKIEEGGVGTITFLGNPKYEEYAYTTTASVILVHHDFQPKKPVGATMIRVADVYSAIGVLLNNFGAAVNAPIGVSPQAVVHAGAQLGANVSVGAFSVVEEGAGIGENSYISSQVYIGKNVKIGRNALLYPGVRILHDCVIGDNCTIHANVVIGSDGFGFAPQPDGSYQKIAQVGIVLIEDNVEIGANTTIDRATMGATIIRKGVKLDNLIQIAHNVEIGENTVIAAQTGIAGSTKIGKSCRIGGQVGISGHLVIADGTQMQGQSGVTGSIKEPGKAISGFPAIGHTEYMRSFVVFRKLPDLAKRLDKLEKQTPPEERRAPD
ncbi:MAG: UDP-3-O-(3-hydroxymyristoyl)glucosamine N-acyltransferase [Saprospiraceae bacterium]|nr:UDP-3-O-(3-hydroxymyristoyl)glucosamine N-acyltransferase [Saprospiraceae bacterium]